MVAGPGADVTACGAHHCPFGRKKIFSFLLFETITDH
jgi:hypothetical protein